MVDKARCATCNKGKGIWRCEGCLQTFCFEHVAHHQQELSTVFEDVEYTCDVIRQTFTEQINNSKNHDGIQKIKEWKDVSIQSIQNKAEDARLIVAKHTGKRTTDLENRLNTLTEELRRSRQDNDYLETDLCQWKIDLAKLQQDIQSTLSNMKFREDSTPLVYNIPVNTSVKKVSIPELSLPPMRNYKRWSQNGITIAGGKGLGSECTQLYDPVSMCMDDNDQSLYIADYRNNRIVKWKKNATYGENFLNGTNQLNRPGAVIIDELNDNFIICDLENRQIVQCPRHHDEQNKTMIPNIVCWGLAMDDSGNLYVSDYERHEVRRWQIGDTHGIVVAGGNKRGKGLNQLDSPTNIFVDHEQSVYVSDHFNHRVMKWKLGAKEGIVVAGNQTEGDDLAQLSSPNGILVDQFDTVYVADTNNHRVMRWLKGSKRGTLVVGGHGHGEQANQLFNPRELSIDRQGNLYIVDSYNHRIQKFPKELN